MDRYCAVPGSDRWRTRLSVINEGRDQYKSAM